ncbi:MAG TPA: hypothetical protein VEK07_11435 [Polyangiaceae bacterium]|nr:hypothetical protein [Polyangiaceae bacterium]
MTAELRAPAAIRITRPYSTEDEYLEHELDTLTRASITLVGAQPRAEGAVLRFELALPSGQVLLRGEGRVVGFKPNALNGLGGLALRFTRLDTRSKALVDKAAALRERRRPPLRSPGSDPPAPPSIALPRPPLASVAPPPEPPQPGAMPPAAARPSSNPPSIATRPSSSPPGPPSIATRPSSNPPGLPATAARPSPVPPIYASSSDLVPRLPSDREALLERLRARARKLDPATVKRLLASRGPT